MIYINLFYMKMSRIFVGLLMILFISGQTTADDELKELTVTGLFQSLYKWSMKIYETLEKHKNPDKSRENIKIIMQQVEEVSSKLDEMETHLDIKLDAMLNTLLADIRLETTLNGLKARLRHCFLKIDNYFDELRRYKIGGAFGNQTLKDFSHKVLWSAGSVPDFLDDLHEIFIPGGAENSGFLSVMLQRTMLNLLHDCDTYISAQQKVYYIYIQLVISEVKGLITQQQTLMIQRWFDETLYNYKSELDIAKGNIVTRMAEYQALFTGIISQFPQHIRRCEVSPPERGVNFLELQKFSRIAILDSNTVINDRCMACPAQSVLDDVGRRTNSNINDCKDMGTEITACPAESGSPHEYLWWRDEAGNHYGPDTPCAKTETINGGSVTVPGYRGSLNNYYFCKVCACSVQTNNVQNVASLWRISVTEQISDIFNNKVVTGVRFVTRDNALHLQIRQARFTFSGMINDDNQWKELDLGFYNAGRKEVKSPMQYEPLRHDRKTLYLDDIQVPEDYAVTGVRFKLVDDSAFKLQIFASQFDLQTGNVFSFGGGWFDASTHPIRPEDYKQKRFEIDMGKSNDPTRSSQFKYNMESNKLIKFTHTDMNKDAGQTTIPLIDSQPVEAQPAFPLSGVGLSFRGRDGFGGYIAPRIYTHNVKKYMEISTIHSNTPPTSSPTEETPIYIDTLDGEDTNSDRLKYTVTDA